MARQVVRAVLIFFTSRSLPACTRKQVAGFPGSEFWHRAFGTSLLMSKSTTGFFIAKKCFSDNVFVGAFYVFHRACR